MEEELKVNLQILLCFLYYESVMCAKANGWKRCFHTLNWTMRRLDMIFCDFICTNIHISIFTILDIFLVSYTSLSLFSYVAVSASGKQKQQWLFLVRRLDRFGYTLFLTWQFYANWQTLYSLSCSLFLIGTRFLFFLLRE